MEHVDVLIIGAGISGIGAGCHLSMKCQDRSFVILENRNNIGGTWDLFRYPGIRSDSDMYTFGYGFKPWSDPSEIAPAEAIRNYLAETVHENQLTDRIRFRHQVTRMDWSSDHGQWTVSFTNHESGEQSAITCNFVLNCTGYYNYEKAHEPNLPGIENFTGRLVHPQFWPEELDYSGKRVLVIGSGATAVTIVPSMADGAVHVTMLQRTPSFVVSRPQQDPLVTRLRRWLPERATWRIKRSKNLLFNAWFQLQCQRQPEKVRQLLVGMAGKQLNDNDDAQTHFNPPYKPWDQRLCLVPDGDLFKAIRSGKASVVTDTIASVNPGGVTLSSGKTVEADIIVSATGIALRFLGGVQAYVDGHPVQTKDLVNFHGTLFGNLPNFASVFGYAKASWTLKVDLSCDYFCRLLNHMRKHNYRVAQPVKSPNGMKLSPMLNLQSGYARRSIDLLPKFGDTSPWKNFDSYLRDYIAIRFARIRHRDLKFH